MLTGPKQSVLISHRSITLTQSDLVRHSPTFTQVERSIYVLSLKLQISVFALLIPHQINKITHKFMCNVIILFFIFS